MGGKGGGISTPNINLQPSPYEARMADIAESYFQSTSPLRNSLLADFGAFMRPPGGRTYGGGGTTGATTVTQQGATSAPFSSNFVDTSSIPSTEDLFGALRLAGAADTSTNERNSAMAILGQAGQNTMPVSAQQMYGQESADYLAALRSQAGDIRQNALNQALSQGMQQISQQGASQTTTTGQGGGGGGELTSQDLYNPYNLPAYAPLYQLARTGIESQYGPAREAIMASTPRGGALYENLANLEMGRAQQTGALPAQISAPLIQDIYNKAYGVAFGAPQTTLSGLGGADAGYTSRYNTASSLAGSAAMQQSALNQQSSMGLGAGLGSLLGFG